LNKNIYVTDDGFLKPKSILTFCYDMSRMILIQAVLLLLFLPFLHEQVMEGGRN